MKDFINIVMKYAGKLNKYWVVGIFFVTITFFIGDHTIFDRIKTDREINYLEGEIERVKTLNEENEKKIEALKTDNETLEKYAREELLMTKPGEEVFIIQ